MTYDVSAPLDRELRQKSAIRRLDVMHGQAVHNGHTEEWQVRQAVRSVEIFQKHYLRHLQETGATVPATVAGKASVAGTPTTFAAALAETRTLIRLRHYAYRTEQTYHRRLCRLRFVAHFVGSSCSEA
jgi:hypothetical protein